MSEAEDRSQIPAEAHIEQQKECLSPPEKAAPEQFFEHGEGNKMPDDAVPAQSMNNSTIDEGGEQSELVKSRTRVSRHCRSAQQNEYLTPIKSATESGAVGETSKMARDLPDDKSKSTGNLQYVVLALKSDAEGYAGKRSRATHSRTELKPAIIDGITNSKSSGRRYRKTPETKLDSEKYALRSSTDKGQRSSIQEKPAAPEPGCDMKNASSGPSGRKRGRKKGQKNGELHDEFSRMRMHLRYLLRRIACEQNLLDAYCSEGWRGQSLEKLRPEKELEHAKLNINRTKLKIRGLFQRLDVICAEGRFPETLFDSDGLIDSEDIFCAKCGRRDLSPNNDIILCDGACDRGFHQLCLDPPLRTEEIPPGDEGWYCPACDCKFDCVELLNDSMGTKLSIEGSWENVFPEAEAKAGSGQDDINGLPSDDSEDNDYNPNGTDDDDDVGGGGGGGDGGDMEEGDSTSDESDFSSASEDLGAIHNNDDQYLGLPSDDSEDDDFDPNIVDAEDQPKQEDSSSDFTSASENLNAVIENDEISSEDKRPNSPSKLVEDLDDSVPVCERRQLERLDYKKLYDETYGNASTDSSDDEEWNDAIKPKSKRNGGKSMSSHESEGEEWKDRVTPKRRRYGPRHASTPTTPHDIPVAAGRLSNVVGNTSTTGKSPLNPKVGVSNDSQTPETSTGFKRSMRQPYTRLGEEVIQRLNASFKENQYPDHTTKDKLAEELGLTPKKISKWFEYTRWSTNHSTVANSSTSKVTPRRGRKAAKSFDEKDSSASRDLASNGVDKAPLDANNPQPNSNTNRRKRKLDVGETSAKKPVRQSARRKNSGKSL